MTLSLIRWSATHLYFISYFYFLKLVILTHMSLQRFLFAIKSTLYISLFSLLFMYLKILTQYLNSWPLLIVTLLQFWNDFHAKVSTFPYGNFFFISRHMFVTTLSKEINHTTSKAPLTLWLGFLLTFYEFLKMPFLSPRVLCHFTVFTVVSIVFTK